MGAVRIVSGRLRGRRVETPKGEGTRPLLSRVRKSLVDILRPRLLGAEVLDLFAGSGAIAFELLSNGASRAVAVEVDPRAAALIRHNADALGAAVEVLESDALSAVDRLAGRSELFDLVIVAPPYGLDLQARALESLDSVKLLGPDSRVVVQRDHREPSPGSVGSFRLEESRAYGRTILEFYMSIVQ